MVEALNDRQVQLEKDSESSLQDMNSILRQKLKESRSVNIALTNEITQIRMKYQAAMDKLVDEVVRLEEMINEGKVHIDVLWEEYQVVKLASVERRKMLAQLRRDHAEEISRMKKSMLMTPNSVKGKEFTTAITPSSNSSDHRFEALLDSALEIMGSGYESPKPTNFSFFPEDSGKDRPLVPHRGSFEQHQEEALLAARSELFKQPPGELPFDVLANLVDEELVSGEGGKTKSHRLSPTEPDRLKEEALLAARTELFKQPPGELPFDILANLVDEELVSAEGGKTISRRLSLTEPRRLKALTGFVNSGNQFKDMHRLGHSGSAESRSEEGVPKEDLGKTLLLARDSLELISANLPIDNSASNSSLRSRPGTSKVTMSIGESHANWKAQDHVPKAEVVSQAIKDTEETKSLDVELSPRVFPLCEVSRATEGKVEKVVMNPGSDQDHTVTDPGNLKVLHMSPNEFPMCLKMEYSSSDKELLQAFKARSESAGSVLDHPHIATQVNIAAEHDFVGDCVSSDASAESSSFDSGSMSPDLPQWIRICTQKPTLEISDPVTIAIMPIAVFLEIQHALSANVKVKQAAEQLELKHSQLDRRRKQSHCSCHQRGTHRNSRAERAFSFESNRNTVSSMKPVMWYNVSARKYRCCNDDSNEVDKSSILKKQETVVPSRSYNSCQRKRRKLVTDYNPNDNKQKGDRRTAPIIGGSCKSNYSQSKSRQRVSDNELKHSSERSRSRNTNGRAKRSRKTKKRSNTNASQNILPREETNIPKAGILKRRSKYHVFGGFFCKS